MSSLSDHFALNTTLRNFCFLAHTEDTHSEQSTQHTWIFFFFSLSAHRKHHSRLHSMASHKTRCGAFPFAQSHRGTHSIFGTARTPNIKLFASHISLFTNNNAPASFSTYFALYNILDWGSGAFCCSTYVTRGHVASSSSQKSGTDETWGARAAAGENQECHASRAQNRKSDSNLPIFFIEKQKLIL